MLFSETSPTREQLDNVSPEELRAFYAAKASINPNLSTPSLPPTIPNVYADTVAQEGKGLAIMAVSEYQGILQNFFVGLLDAKRILEIGTFTGSSAIFFANALKRNGVAGGPDANGNKPVICLDISEKYANIARKNFVEAGVEDYIEVIVGDAQKSLASLEGQTFDMVFLDADKPAYKYYYDMAIEKNMISKKGLIIADNTAFDFVTPYLGISAPVPDDARPLNVSFEIPPCPPGLGKAIHEFNEYVRNDPRTEVVLMPLFTGLTFIRLLKD
ncbi:S-adenosyl-L-methionine-dependent methyltransferase [Coemansia reversa NRRL 1564]|uniref:S-adenosyl-L-methionine-dependent methyltransferase n=1 Tax=Coemansia reversa (strain ATCC 12441 / NRRL 1564) TaxID=763665 RepID=A0A2G5B9P1_COERN|nr:S-adenosyl-L-methionine-dependent methyltransferase [Coemansia reversa NRRL 1564]|eukprot:PIA15447.1 S-adenosyl-L-methionine-dependent methyltransferase [Coemansia reversa NRRL 1564]